MEKFTLLNYASPFKFIYSYLCIKKEICGDQFSPLIARMSVLHAVGILDEYVEGFDEKKF